MSWRSALRRLFDCSFLRASPWTTRYISTLTTDHRFLNGTRKLECTVVLDGGHERMMGRRITQLVRDTVHRASIVERVDGDPFTWLVKVLIRDLNDFDRTYGALQVLPYLLQDQPVKKYASRRQLREYSLRPMAVTATLLREEVGPTWDGNNCIVLDTQVGEKFPDVYINQLEIYGYNVTANRDRSKLVVELMVRDDGGSYIGHQLRVIGNILRVRFCEERATQRLLSRD